jgi:uncharacterized protein
MTATTPHSRDHVSSLVPALLQFVHRLREASIPVSMVEAVDAMESLERIDIANRRHFRSALASTLVKRAEHLPAFDSVFDIYFATPSPAAATGDGDPAGASRYERAEDGEKAPSEAPPSDHLLEALLQALRGGDQQAMRALAGMAVEQFAGIEEQRDATHRYYLYRILRRLDLQRLWREALNRELVDAGDLTPLEQRLLRDEHLRRMEEFRKLLAEEIRRRLAQIRGAREAAEFDWDRSIEGVDFLRASPFELQQIREAIRPLAQKLASRIARRRRIRRRGRLDVRRTVRRSLSAGGVPLDPAFRRPKAAKPELYLLCDISGSVAEFARFTMSLLHAMQQEFSKIRLFVFVDGIDEVTQAFEESGEWLAPRNLLHRASVIAADGHSDYGNVFNRFWHRWGQDSLDSRATVIVTGDARNNYRESGAGILKLVHDRARKVYWLNPEPRADWSATDSVMEEYAPWCDGVFEVRNLRQLAEFVYQIA